jgi:hypothetical protein
MDGRAVETLNHWFAANALRAGLGRTLAIVPLAVIAGLVVLSWIIDPSNSPDRRACGGRKRRSSPQLAGSRSRREPRSAWERCQHGSWLPALTPGKFATNLSVPCSGLRLDDCP